MKSLFVTFFALMSFPLESKELIEENIYRDEKCFFEVKEHEDFGYSFNFAHKATYDAQLPAEPSYPSFHPLHLMGTIVFIDPQTHRAPHGPDLCGHDGRNKSLWLKIKYFNRSSIVLGCGGPFDKFRVRLYIHLNSEKEITSFKYEHHEGESFLSKKKIEHYRCQKLKAEF